MKSIIDGLPYPVIITDDAPADAAEIVAANAKSAVIIADRRLAPRITAVAEALAGAAVEVRGVVQIAAGEHNKNQRTVTSLYRALVEDRGERDTIIVAIGGGTLTDVAGFVAATFLRGLRWIAVSTTLLGMVDAAIGGKTGIDLPEGKNLAGAIWHPLASIADLRALDTLPLAQRRGGLAEVVKCAVIASPALLDAVKRQKLRAAADAWAPLIAAAAQVKVDIVAQDPQDRGPRAQLNLGHTTAHAIEHVSHYRIAHGPALSVGLRVAGILAREKTGWTAVDHAHVLRTLKHAGLPLTLPQLPLEELVEATQTDKKRTDDAVRYVLPVRLGEVLTGVTIGAHELARALSEAQRTPEEAGW